MDAIKDAVTQRGLAVIEPLSTQGPRLVSMPQHLAGVFVLAELENDQAVQLGDSRHSFRETAPHPKPVCVFQLDIVMGLGSVAPAPKW